MKSNSGQYLHQQLVDQRPELSFLVSDCWLACSKQDTYELFIISVANRKAPALRVLIYPEKIWQGPDALTLTRKIQVGIKSEERFTRQ